MLERGKVQIRFKLDEYGIVPKMLGTCNPTKGFLYNRFYKPHKENKLPENLKFIQSLMLDNPHITQHYRESLLQLDNVTKERLLFGNWEYDDDPSALIPFNKILDLFTATHVSEQGSKYITCDVARFGSDKTVIMVWQGYVCTEILTLYKQPISVVAQEIIRLKNYYHTPTSNIIADEDGVGGGVVDIVRCKGFVNNSSPIDRNGIKQNFNNLKSQCYFLLADKINKGEIYVRTQDIEVKNSLVQELEQIKRHNADKDGKLAVLPKDHIKERIGRSPDYSDALMMRMWFELKPPFRYMTDEEILEDFL